MEKSKSEIARRLNVDRSTIKREIDRNKDLRSGKYNPELAQRKRDGRMRGRNHYTKMTDAMKGLVDKHLESDLSPEQISSRLKKEGVDIVSHETIYKYVYDDKRLKDKGKGLYKHLRHQGRKYAKRGNEYRRRGQIVGRVDIDQRPDVVAEKARFGDLEGDTIIGKNHKGAIATFNDRKTGLLWMKKLSGKEADPLAAAAVELLSEVKPLLHTMTLDNGKEFAKHMLIAKELEIDIYFAHPYHSWERGANENTNGLIRQYFPKGTNFEEITEEQVAKVQNILNNRPRKRLGYKTPLEAFQEMYPDFRRNVAFST